MSASSAWRLPTGGGEDVCAAAPVRPCSLPRTRAAAPLYPPPAGGESDGEDTDAGGVEVAVGSRLYADAGAEGGKWAIAPLPLRAGGGGRAARRRVAAAVAYYAELSASPAPFHPDTPPFQHPAGAAAGADLAYVAWVYMLAVGVPLAPFAAADVRGALPFPRVCDIDAVRPGDVCFFDEHTARAGVRRHVAVAVAAGDGELAFAHSAARPADSVPQIVPRWRLLGSRVLFVHAWSAADIAARAAAAEAEVRKPQRAERPPAPRAPPPPAEAAPELRPAEDQSARRSRVEILGMTA